MTTDKRTIAVEELLNRADYFLDGLADVEIDLTDLTLFLLSMSMKMKMITEKKLGFKDLNVIDDS